MYKYKEYLLIKLFVCDFGRVWEVVSKLSFVLQIVFPIKFSGRNIYICDQLISESWWENVLSNFKCFFETQKPKAIFWQNDNINTTFTCVTDN